MRIPILSLFFCSLVGLSQACGQTMAIPWSSFSQASGRPAGATTSVLSMVGPEVPGSSSGSTTMLSSGFLSAISLYALVTDVAEETSLPQSFELYQNYPNPFNPTTTIAYDIPALSRVSVQVFNMVGQLVMTLVDQEQAPGRYSIVWNGRTEKGGLAASGVYFYRISAIERNAAQRHFVSTRKVVLLK